MAIALTLLATGTVRAGTTELGPAVEPCAHRFVSNGIVYRYAEHTYARQTATMLARISVVGRRTGAEADTPGGYVEQRVAEGVYLKDGAVAVVCAVGNDVRFDRITFVSPTTNIDRDDPW
jgi:hypothetical protein